MPAINPFLNSANLDSVINKAILTLSNVIAADNTPAFGSNEDVAEVIDVLTKWQETRISEKSTLDNRRRERLQDSIARFQNDLLNLRELVRDDILSMVALVQADELLENTFVYFQKFMLDTGRAAPFVPTVSPAFDVVVNGDFDLEIK